MLIYIIHLNLDLVGLKKKKGCMLKKIKFARLIFSIFHSLYIEMKENHCLFNVIVQLKCMYVLSLR